MEVLKVGDLVRILPGVAIPFVGCEGTIHDIQRHELGIEAMDRHVVIFEHREKRLFYRTELMHLKKPKNLRV